MGYIRKDRRIQTFTISADSTDTLLLECSGREPLMIYVSGNDVSLSYEPGGTAMTLLNGYQYTWETQHPFGGEVFATVSGTDATVVFMIGGSVQ